MTAEEIKELYIRFDKGICWECRSSLCVDFLNPDKDNWVMAKCPSCSYQVYVPRLI